ncbi:SAM-dependent methyltransferase [Cryptosporangium minutisporangium]|uniref:SAM-dependent methyltransferase n=1 Tax=Cryptosporangium minutisporangium TaxID=113569 RepID=A0ABP6STH3_9ACTN
MAPPGIDTSVAHPARRYDYWLGGKDNFAADRAAGDAIAAAYPSIRTLAIENRRFLRRAVRFLAVECGIRQFLDIGTGIPSANNTHEVAQSVAPESRVVYVDNDPIVLVHARALLRGGATDYLDGDFRQPEDILERAAKSLDFRQPVGLMLVALLHLVRDEDTPYAHVATLVDACAPGSCLTISHGTADFVSAETRAKVAAADAKTPNPSQVRSKDEIARFFTGLEIVEPGIVPISEWRAEGEPAPRPTPEEVSCYGALAHKL